MSTRTRTDRRPPEVLPAVALMLALLLTLTPHLFPGRVSSEQPTPTTRISMAKVAR